MPLVKSASRKAVSENIRREREAGKPQRQAVAIALDVQRRAKGGRHMAENSSHAPGSEISGKGSTRQRNQMGMGDGPMAGGSFGIGPLPGTHHLDGMGSHMPHDGVMLHDHHRAGPPALHQGDDAMHATAHSKHGPHHHSHEHHHTIEEGTRAHHVGGAHSTKHERGRK